MTPATIKRIQTITLPVPPGSNNRLRPGVDGNGNVRLYLAKEVRQYVKGVAQVLLFLKPVPKPLEVAVTLTWFRASERDGDLDNRLKILLDVLSKHGYQDDSQIARLVYDRALDPRNPRFTVTIEVLE